MKKTHSIFIGLLIAGIISIPLFYFGNEKIADNQAPKKSVKAATSNTVFIYAQPTFNDKLPVGQFDITITMGTQGNDIAGIELMLKSSSVSTLELTGFTPAQNPIPNYAGSFATIVNQPLSSGELYRYAVVNPTSTNVFTGNENDILTLGVLHAKMKKVGTANLLVEINSSVVTNSTTPISVANAGGFIGTYTVPAPPTATPVPPTAVPSVPTATPVPPTPTAAQTYVPPAAPTATTAPAAPTTTGTPVCQPHSKGNANGDCVISIDDYTRWLEEITGKLTTKTADFNKDGKVNILDFNIWRIGFVPGINAIIK